MTLLLIFVTIVTGVGIVMTSPASVDSKDAVAEAELSKRNSYSCNVNGRVYRHGEIFTIGKTRCVKYQCNAGTYDFYEEGCDMADRCWPANQSFRYQCRDYMCHAYQVGNGYKRYEVTPLGRQLCQDYLGYCHRPGEHFAYVMKGRLRRTCTCKPAGATISYYCYGRD